MTPFDSRDINSPLAQGRPVDSRENNSPLAQGRPFDARDSKSPLAQGRRTALAWLVHLYTASGLIAAMAMGVLIFRGGDAAFRAAFALMIVATAIDATDGYFARAVNVKRVLPEFDGTLLDNLVDFHTYTTLPIFLLWRAEILPPSLRWLLLLPVLASAYGYSQTHAKTDDGFFVGFPSLWNVVAFYVYFLQMPVWAVAAIIAALSVATFIPTRYLYPSRGGPYGRILDIVGVVWIGLTVLVVARPLGERTPLALLSLTYPLAYLALSFLVSRRMAVGHRTSPIGRVDPR
jgi:phosphatidylcholine synthase